MVENRSLLIVVTRGIVGGVSSAVLPLAKELKARGVRVEFGVGEGEYLKKEAGKSFIPITEFKYLRRSHNPLINILFAFELLRFVRKNKFRTVHLNSSNSLFGALFLRLFSVRSIFVVHGLSFLDKNHGSAFVRALYWIIFKILLTFPSLVIFVSRANFKRAHKIRLCSLRKSVYIPNAIETPEYLSANFARAELAKKCGISLEGKKVLGSIGRFAYPKNYEFIISAMPQILKQDSSWVCILIGDGSERRKYQMLVTELGLEKNVFFTGELEGASRYLKAFDLFVLPSIYEGMSIVLMEAVLAGIPILASDVGGNSEIIGKDRVFTLNDQKGFIDMMSSENVASAQQIDAGSLSRIAEEYLFRIKNDK